MPDKKKKFTLTGRELQKLRRIERLLEEAASVYDRLDSRLRHKIRDYHNESSGLPHCLRWGQQAAGEILEDSRPAKTAGEAEEFKNE